MLILNGLSEELAGFVWWDNLRSNWVKRVANGVRLVTFADDGGDD
ncbi:MAG TPA: hypothetical protein VKP61_02150 [Candidatus Acidoferrum sp.]|nr:hypothetical protein [Candidatus Acidoferrum sp.]